MSWDYQETNYVVQFNQIPHKQDVHIVLHNWHKDLSEQYRKTDLVKVKAEFASDTKLTNDHLVRKHCLFELHFWQGLYHKWETSQKLTLDTEKPVEIIVHKTNRKIWCIKFIKNVGD